MSIQENHFLVFSYNCNLAQSLFALMTLTYWTFLISVFVHSKEDSIWLHLSIPPIRMTSIHIDILQRPDICVVDGIVTEKRIISLNKPYNPCTEYTDGPNGFVKCIKNCQSNFAFWQSFQMKKIVQFDQNKKLILLKKLDRMTFYENKSRRHCEI